MTSPSPKAAPSDPLYAARYDRPFPIVTVADLDEATAWFSSAGWTIQAHDDATEVVWRGCRLWLARPGSRFAASAPTNGLAVVVEAESLQHAEAMFQASASEYTRSDSRFGPVIEGTLPGDVRLVVAAQAIGPIPPAADGEHGGESS